MFQTPTRATALLAALLLGCSGGAFFAARGVPSRCEDPHPAPRAPQPPPGPAHGDYLRLRPYRAYTRVVSVGEPRHHFAAFWSCIEPTYSEYEVTDQGDITPGRGAWGGLAVRDGDPPEPPASVERLAENVRDHVARHTPDASDIAVSYRGFYREVLVEEVFPFFVGGDASQMLGASTLVTFAADAAMTHLERPPSLVEGAGFGLLCYAPECRAAPRWLDLTPTSWSLPLRAMTDAPDAPTSRALADRVLALVRDRREVPLDALLARTDVTAVPEGPQPLVHTGFTMYARPTGGAAQPSESLDVTVSPDEVLGRGASAEGRVTWLGRTFTLRVSITRDGPMPEGDGLHPHVPMTARYHLDDGRRTHEHAVPLDGEVHVAGGRAVLLTWSPRQGDGPQGSVHEPPLGVHFDAPPGYSSVDAYFTQQTYLTP